MGERHMQSISSHEYLFVQIKSGHFEKSHAWAMFIVVVYFSHLIVYSSHLSSRDNNTLLGYSFSNVKFYNIVN